MSESAEASTESCVIGVDVGAPRKGYHAVALREVHLVGQFHSCDPAEMARWCVEQGAGIVAVDAPCRWRMHGAPARAAERELAADRISCFSTPTEEKARSHAFYTWMFAGQELYAALSPHYPIYTGEPQPARLCIETFPQAVACTLAGESVSAKAKLAVRTEVLTRAGLEAGHFGSIDEVDAALCALTARRFVEHRFKAYGDAAGGFIIVPSEPLPPPAGAAAERWAAIRAARPATKTHRRALAKILALLPTLSTSERLELAQTLRAQSPPERAGPPTGRPNASRATARD